MGAFLVATGVALLAGAKNLGTALTFGQLAFAAALVFVLLRGRWGPPAPAARSDRPPPPAQRRRRGRR